MTDNRIFEYVEKGQMERLLRGIAELAGVALRLSDAKGETLCGPFNFTELCARYNFACRPDLCKASAVKRMARLTKDQLYHVFECAGDGDRPGESGAGIFDAVVPIRVADEHIASINCGQVLFEQPDTARRARFQDFATHGLGLGGEELRGYLRAVDSLRIMPRERLTTILDFLGWLANLVSSYAYDHHQVTQLHPLMKARARSPEQIVADVLATVSQVCAGTLGITLWYCDGEGSLVLKALWGFEPVEISRRVMPMNRSISGRALREGQVKFAELPDDPDFCDPTLLERHGPCRLAAIPFVDLAGGDRHLGAVAVFLDPAGPLPSEHVIALVSQTRGMLETALHRESDLHRQGIIAAAATLLTADEDNFWSEFDRIVLSTLPNVRAYVLYMQDEYREHCNPVRTGVFDGAPEFNQAQLRKFCRHVLRQVTDRGRAVAHHDLLSSETPQPERDLFQQTFVGPRDAAPSFSAVGVPLRDKENRLVGGMICVAARTAQKPDAGVPCFVFPTFAHSHISAMQGLGSVLSIVLARQNAERARAVAQAVRMHELVAPLHAMQGYHENLVCMFRDLKSRLSSQELDYAPFEAQLTRLGYLCELLGLIATSDALEGPTRLSCASFERDILLPIVQPLRAYALAEKGSSVWYASDLHQELPAVWLAVNRMKQCVFNLVFNAVKYSMPYTRIAITLHTGKDRDSPEWEIHVRNQGIGVPRGDEDRIFWRFTQGSNADQVAASGSGLGLYVARAIARKHGGDVVLRNGSPENTVFVLKLPYSLRDRPPESVQKELGE